MQLYKRERDELDENISGKTTKVVRSPAGTGDSKDHEHVWCPKTPRDSDMLTKLRKVSDVACVYILAW